MKIRKINLLLLLFVSAFLPSIAQENTFTFMRPVNGVDEQAWYAIELPDNIFQHLSPDFNDLRVYTVNGNDTTEAPYLLKIYTDDITKKVLSLPVINRTRKGNELLFTFEVPATQPVNQLEITLKEKNYDATVRVDGSHDQKEWFPVISDQRILSIQNNAVQYTYATVNFPSIRYPFIRVGITSDSTITFDQAALTYLETKPGTFKDMSATYTIDKEYNNTVVHLKLKEHVPVSKVTVEAQHPIDYYRTFSIEAFSDSVKTPKGWKDIYQEVYRGHITSLRPNTFDFTYFPTSKLRLTIYNQDNAPLEIKNIDMLYPVVEVVTYLKPGKNILLYGNQWLQKPSYDLVYFQEKIPSEPLAASLGDEVSIAGDSQPEQPLLISKWWLWAVLLFLIAILGYFTLKMMK